MRHLGATLNFFETANPGVFRFTIDGVFSGDWFTHSRFAQRAAEALELDRVAAWRFLDQVTNTAGFVLAGDCDRLVRDFYRGVGWYRSNERGDHLEHKVPPTDLASAAVVANIGSPR